MTRWTVPPPPWCWTAWPAGFALADVTITGIADKHARVASRVDPPAGGGAPPLRDMVVYLVETGGLRILIWGDNRHDPPPDFWKALGRIDVLTVPVDGSQHILSYAEADSVVERLRPGIVIPTHYLCEATTRARSTLLPADEWVRSRKSFRMLDGPALRLMPAEVARMDRECLYFGHHARTA